MRAVRMDAEHKGIYLLLLAFHAAQALGKENERGMKKMRHPQNNCRLFGEYIGSCKRLGLRPTAERWKLYVRCFGVWDD